MLNKLLIFLLFIFLFIPIQIFAQDTQTNKVDYSLPYPGILPDHPLYPLKVFRDKVYGFLVSDLVKKTEFKLLMADKRLFMGIMLMDKGKPEFAEQTISKASKYYEEAVLTLYKAEKAERDVDFLRHRLIDASRKHQEIISEYQKTATSHVKSGLQGSLERILKYRAELVEKDSNLQNNK